MRARLSDVAAQAGVSEATVSRVLNGRSGVSDAVRRAVLTAVDVLGYQRPARLLPRAGGLVGVVVPELENPVFPAFVQRVETTLARHGYSVVLCTQTPDGLPEEQYLQMLAGHGVGGLLVISGLNADVTADPAPYAELVARGLPLVLVNGAIAGVAAPSLSTDDRAAAQLAVRHLTELGHRRIALAVGPRRYVPVVRKIEGFTAALRRYADVEDPAAWIECSMFGVEGGAAALERLAGRGVTAVVCGSDLMALGAVRAARAAGLSVPGDLSVVGFDDSLLVAYTDPPLTTVRQAVGALAAAAVRTLLEEIAGQPVARHELLFAPDLVVRGSTAPVRRG